jgi:NADPH:quinone reductase-like Zn-dependent oxidoreductase
MKAIVYTKYGSPDVLQLKEVEKPVPRDNEVLVKVHAASVNSWDWDLLRGKPVVFRFWGVLKPKYTIPGGDIAGEVAAVGRNVTRFKPGDEVLGDLCACGWGGFAEFVCASEKALTLKPANMSFEDAASLPQAAVLALQGLREKRHIQNGDSVLINGGAGGVGTLAIQMAKSFGAEVSAVDRGEKLDFMRSLGADNVFDFTREDFTKNGQDYDLIIDVAAHHSIFDYKRVLNPGGHYAIIGGSVPRILQILSLGPIVSMTGDKKLGILAHKPNKDLDEIIELIQSGKVKPIIDRSYALSEVPEAFRYFGTGQVKGKIVISVGSK